MKIKILMITALLSFFQRPNGLFAQNSTNCFLKNHPARVAFSPTYIYLEKPSPAYTTEVNILDSLVEVSPYVFGNAVAVWTGNTGSNATFVKNAKLLELPLVRFPGGSWSDIFFWNACDNSDIPGCPSELIDGMNNTRSKFYSQVGGSCSGNWRMTTDNYYSFKKQLNTQALMTVNYGYARYGQSENPVAQAAHLAADWVRYDKGRSKYWEIGNESGGPWEAGWKIDVTKNKDGQPEIITGELYGNHFKVFADSMRKAASEINSEIYIGAQILHFDGTNSWNTVDRTWNSQLFKTIGNTADFYVVHNYFGAANTASPKSFIEKGQTDITAMMNFMKNDIKTKNAALKPIAMTEWNISASTEAQISTINGLQAITIFNELIKNGYGMSCRWLLANWETDGLLYKGESTTINEYTPRPDFYFLYYLSKFTGDFMLSTSSTSTDILAYSTKFSSGETGLVVINKNNTEKIVKINPKNLSDWKNYYVYSLTGKVIGNENANFPMGVNINGYGPQAKNFGPIDNLSAIPAQGYIVGDEIKVVSPGYSAQFILLDSKERIATKNVEITQNNDFSIYPNPSNGSFSIILPEKSQSIGIYNLSGEQIYSQEINSDQTSLEIHMKSDMKGIYLVKIKTGKDSYVAKVVIQ